MTDSAESMATKRERSPSFPYIGLEKAVERTRQFMAQARRSEALVADAASTWDMGAKSSSTLMTIGALLGFGLIEDSGSGESRKIRVSDTGARILGDDRPGIREKLLAEAALKPKLIAEYAQTWRDGRPSDQICISELKFDKGFNDEAASRFLRVFDETIRFTNPAAGDSKADIMDPEATPLTDLEIKFGGADIGDLIQWTSAGVDQLPTPAKVIQVSEDGRWLWIEGSSTGIPMDQAHVTEKGAATPPQMPPIAPPSTNTGAALLAGEREWLRGPLSKDTAYRLVIAGDMGPKEIGK